MPRDKGFGRKKKKMKAATEVEVEVGAGGDVEVSIVVSPRPKRTRQSRKKAPAGPTPLQPPPFAGVATFERAAEAVREAAAALEKASFVLELAEERYRRHLAKGEATMQRLRKLREKQGERSAKWSSGWMKTMNELDAEESKLDGELQLRLDEVAAYECRLAEQQERLPQVHGEVVAWQAHEKAMLEAKREEMLRESDGSSPDGDSDSDEGFDEQLDLDELHIDAEAPAEPP